MLVEFSVENFLSFKDRTTFSLLATSDNSLPENLFQTDALTGKNKNLLKSTAIFGANASGKSNLISIMRFLRYLVRTSNTNQPGDTMHKNFFKLDESCEFLPSSFEVIFISDNVKYCYGVTIDSQKVHEEYLYHWPKGRKQKVFERWNTSEYSIMGISDSEKDKLKQEVYLESTLDNILFLSQAAHLKHPIITKAFNWFLYDLRFIFGPASVLSYTLRKSFEDVEFKKRVLDYLKLVDIEIDDLRIKQISKNSDELPKTLLEKLSSADTKNFYVHEVTTMHTGKDKQGKDISVPFDFTEESEGTRTFIDLIGPIIDSLENGYTVFIDELDSSLHPNILKTLVKIMNHPELNKNRAQFVFTTHCTNILESALLRRDQIWFTDKDKLGSTQLVSLSEYGTRKDLNLQKAYLEGRFGAIPFINEEI